MTSTRIDPLLPVVVAVSADGYDAGVRFAAAEAVRGGGPLHVVHVLGLDTGSAEQAARICFLAVERARDLVGERVPVTSEIFHGDLIDGLVELSRRARLVVLQRHAIGSQHVEPRATSTKVAAHAGVPVVCVPRHWNGHGRGTITVGVDDTRSCVPLLRAALSAARSRGARLRIVHVDLPSDECDSAMEIRSALAEADTSPDIETSIEISVATTPIAALIEAMATSELLVLGRHHPLIARGSRLGPVARRVVRDASCPVLLVTPSMSTSSPDWVFAGHLA